jgi:hypothetical protein
MKMVSSTRCGTGTGVRRPGSTRKLIATAEANGQFRLVEMNRKVEVNLGSIIATLETLEAPDAR